MIVSVLKAQAKSPEAAQQVCRLFYQSLELHYEPGWLRGSCMTDIKDRRDVFIHEHWSNLAAWEAWQNSPADRFLREEAAPFLDTPWETSLYEGPYVMSPK